ncbi:putative MFS-type transporter like protein [Verticillium longisporum]|nr:putative MFS-type transporter like protein [Verticillium longisporum]KAG7150583.1 putative MFS-type transporter like protein [Verticillium longisporum]
MTITVNQEAMAQTESVPGTVYLVDTGHVIESRHADGGDIVLDPVPSSDPSDPLNWSRRRKLLAVVCQNLYTWFCLRRVHCHAQRFNMLNATSSIILSGPPYNFPPSMVGRTYISCFVGVILGSIFSGRLSDWLTIKLTRRNNGIMESEYRLWPFPLCVVMVPGGLILWGVGAAHGVHWFGLIFAMGSLAFATTIDVTLSVNYLIDSYHDISGDAIVTVILIRNTMSFAVSYGITPWLMNLGYQNCFISAAFIGMATSSVFFVMIKYGKKFRIRSASKYHRLVSAAESKWSSSHPTKVAQRFAYHPQSLRTPWLIFLTSHRTSNVEAGMTFQQYERRKCGEAADQDRLPYLLPTPKEV